MNSRWIIKPAIKFEIDTTDYMICFLPTIIWMPWKYRYPNSYVFDITWLNLHIGIGLWQRKD